MAGFLLSDDADTAVQNLFDQQVQQRADDWNGFLQQQQQNVQNLGQQTSDAFNQQVQQRANDWQTFLSSQQPAQQPTQPAPTPAPQPIFSTVTPPAPAPATSPTTPTADDTAIQQRADDWQTYLKSPQAQVQQPLPSPNAPVTAPLQAPQPQTQQTPQPSGYVFPVQDFQGKVQDHWGSVLGGSDLFAPRGTPVVAMRGGKVLESGYNTIGGNAVLVQGDDGNQYYYAHFDKPPSVKVGDTVDAGTPIGVVGNTGDAQNTGTHLHIGIGPDIKLGADKYGGTGGDYDAVGLLQRTLDNTAKAPASSVSPTQQVSSGNLPSPSQIADYIRYAAAQRGIDPETAVKVANSEGLNAYTGDQGSSFGPFQLHMGGLAPVGSGNEGSGLGDAFQKVTGLDPRDPSTWAQQVNFALDNARNDGWGPWHGAARVGIGARDGIGTFMGDVGQYAQAAQDALKSAGQGAQDLLSGVVQGAQDYAARAADLAKQSTALAASTGQSAQQALDQLRQAQAQNQAWADQFARDQERQRQQLLNDSLNAVQTFTSPLTMGGLNDLGQPFTDLGSAVQSALPGVRSALQSDFAQDFGQGFGQAAQQSLMTQPGLAQAEGARQSLDVLTDPRYLNDPGARTLAFVNLVGSVMPPETRPNEVLEAAQSVANAVRSVPDVLQGARGPIGTFVRDTAGELRLPGEPAAPGTETRVTPPEPDTTRMYHGTGSDFPRVSPEAVSGTDATGAPIEHTANVIFPESLDKIRNAISQTQGGAANPMFAARLGGAVGGGYLGYQSAPENATPQERIARTLIGAGTGVTVPSLLEAAVTRPSIDQTLLERLRQGGLAGRPPPAPPPGSPQRIQWLTGTGPWAPPTPRPLPSSPVGVVTDLTRQGMLTNPWTHIQNIAQNVAEILGNTAQVAIGGGGREAAAGNAAALRSISEAWQNARLAMGGRQVATLGSEAQNIPVRWKGSGWIYRALSAGDIFTRTIAEYQGMAQRGLRMLEDAGIQPGTAQAAQYLTTHADQLYREGAELGARSVFGTAAKTGATATALDRFFSGLGRYKEGLLSGNPLQQALGFLLDTQIPFTGVPSRVYQLGIKRLPGVSQVAYGIDLAKALKSGDTLAAHRAMGGLMLTTMVQAEIADQIEKGNITSSDDPEHPSAANVGGQWLPLRTMPYVGLPMSIMADFAKGWEKGGQQAPGALTGERVGSALTAAMKPLLQGVPGFDALRVINTLGQIGPLEAGEDVASGVLSRFVPSAAGEAERFSDPYQRDIAQHGWQAIYEPTQARTPGAAGLLPPKVDPYTGESMPGRSTGVGSLFSLQNRATSALQSEIDRLNQDYPGLQDYRNYPDTVTWKGVTIKLTPDEQRAVTRQLGQERASLESLVSSPEWKDVPDAQKAKTLQRALTKYDDQKLKVWLANVNPDDAAQRWQANQRQLGRLVGAA